MKKFAVFILFLFLAVIIFAQDKETEKLNDPHNHKKIEEQWKTLKEYIQDNNLSSKQRLAILKEFIDQYEEQNTEPVKEAREMREVLKKQPEKYSRKYNPYRKGLEWLALAPAISTFGIGIRLDLFTLKFQNFYWDIVKYHMMIWGFWGYGIIPGIHAMGLKWSSQVGIPIWLSKDQEIRIGTGPSWGVLEYWNTMTGKQARNYINWAFDISYLRHKAKNRAFQAGIAADFALYYDGIYTTINNQRYLNITYKDYFRNLFHYPQICIYIGGRF